MRTGGRLVGVATTMLAAALLPLQGASAAPSTAHRSVAPLAYAAKTSTVTGRATTFVVPVVCGGRPCAWAVSWADRSTARGIAPAHTRSRTLTHTWKRAGDYRLVLHEAGRPWVISRLQVVAPVVAAPPVVTLPTTSPGPILSPASPSPILSPTASPAPSGPPTLTLAAPAGAPHDADGFPLATDQALQGFEQHDSESHGGLTPEPAFDPELAFTTAPGQSITWVKVVVDGVTGCDQGFLASGCVVFGGLTSGLHTMVVTLTQTDGQTATASYTVHELPTPTEIDIRDASESFTGSYTPGSTVSLTVASTVDPAALITTKWEIDGCGVHQTGTGSRPPTSVTFTFADSCTIWAAVADGISSQFPLVSEGYYNADVATSPAPTVTSRPATVHRWTAFEVRHQTSRRRLST